MDEQPTNDAPAENPTGDKDSPTNPPPEIINLWGEPQIQSAAIAKDFYGIPGGSKLSLGLNDVVINLEQDKGPLTAAVMATLAIPFTPSEDKQLMGIIINLQGGITKSKGSRATMQLDILGLTQTLVFPFDEERNSQDDSRVLEHLFRLEKSFVEELEEPSPPLPPCVITLVLTAQRSSINNWVLVGIENIELIAIEFPKKV
jgi:hypothetical protein